MNAGSDTLGTVADRPRATGPRTSWANRMVVRLLGSQLRPLLDERVSVLRYTARSGSGIALPVQAAEDRGTIVVLAGNAGAKSWWRHFTRAASVDLWYDGQWHGGTGTVTTGPDGEAAAAYRRSYPNVALPADATFVRIGFPEPLPPRRVLRGRPFTRVWFWTVTLAETAGFAVPAGVGALTADAGPAIVVPALLAAGAVEGAALGWGQAAVLRHALPALSHHRWVLATAGAAALAYLIGLIPSTVADRAAGWPAALLVVAAALLGCALLGSIGTAQWWVLRHHVAHAVRWVPATAVAWTVGLGVFLGFTMPLWRPGQDTAVTVAIGVTGGLLMAATTAAITGVTMRRLLPSAKVSPGPA